MGFDNECILNIQSLPGEYFCPVCRLLVYPNEALQSLCTHLYCKPCLTYIVGTTRACPYDGYLVTEADSKPIIESNKTLSETIGKITVHCLYQRSGCTWQGSLAECTTHCASCAFGNSPVVCNRCAIQIVHRQVQEHAQICSGVPQQVQNAQGAQNSTTTAATAASTQAQQTQAATQTVASTPQAQTSTASSSTPAQEPNAQAISTTQTQSTVQAAMPTAEQWYQQQQLYQQYYQQYHGYDPYQQQYQQYYPYQQQEIPQSQVQPQAQPLTQPYSQPQSNAPIQLPVTSQPQSQVQVNPQQSQSQIQSQAQPPVSGQPQPQAFLQTLPIQANSQVQISQYQQPNLLMQHLQPQIQAQSHAQLQPQQQIVLPPQSSSQPLPQTPSQHPPQPLPQPLSSQPNQPVNPNLQPQTPNPSTHAVTGHHSFPQPQIHQQAMLGAPPSAYMNPQVGLQLQSKHPVQMQSQLTQKSSLLCPPQSHAIVQNARQPGLVPSPGKVPFLSSAQQLVQQRPVMQPVQQAMHQLHTQQHQLFSGQTWGLGQNQSIQQFPPYAHAQLRPQGPPQAIQHPSHAQLTNQSLAGRPTTPAHGVPTQSYPPSGAGVQVRPMQVGANQKFGDVLLSVATSRPMLGRQGDGILEKGEDVESLSQKAIKKDPSEIKTVKTESESKLVDHGSKASIKQVKEELAEDSNDGRNISNIGSKASELSAPEDKGIDNGTALPVQEAEHIDRQNMKMQMEKNLTSQPSAGFPATGHVQGVGSVQRPHSVPVLDQGKQQAPLSQYYPSAQQQPPGPAYPSQLPGHPPNYDRPFGPGQPLNAPPESTPGGIAGPGSTLVFGKGPRPNFIDGRQPDVSGQHSGMNPNGIRMNGASALDSSSILGFRDDKLRSFPHELNPLSQDPSRHVSNQAESQDLKRFPMPPHADAEPVARFGNHFSSLRPFDRGSHGLGLDVGPMPLDKGSCGLKFDSELNMDRPGGTAPMRFFPPPHDGSAHPGDIRERPMSFPGNSVGRSDSAQNHPDFLGSIPGFGRHHMDDLASRSPGRDYKGLDDMGVREARRFGDPLSNSFRDGRFPLLPGHLRRGEFEGLVEGQPSHLLRGEHLGPRNLPGHLRYGDLTSFGAFPGPTEMGESAGPGGFFHPRFGEPGFRSSFSLRRFPGDVGSYAGDLESFDNSRKRKAPTMGWCRICKVDCETVEGLDLHSQAREHQKVSLDIVAVIKRNAKKQKLSQSDHSSLEDGSKSKNSSSKGHGDKL